MSVKEKRPINERKGKGKGQGKTTSMAAATRNQRKGKGKRRRKSDNVLHYVYNEYDTCGVVNDMS